MTNKKLKIALAVALAVVATAVDAQYIRPAYAYPAAPTAAGPARLQVGDTPLYVMPFIGEAIGHDDNLFLARNNKKSTNLYITSPGLKFDARSEATVLQLDYQAAAQESAQDAYDREMERW